MGRADTPPPAAGAASGAAAQTTVLVVCAVGPQQVLQATVHLPAGATAWQALRASGLAEQLPPGMLDQLTLGLWGRACSAHTVLQPGDRLELTRALKVDPKEARRQRYRRDGVRRQPPRRREPAV